MTGRALLTVGVIAITLCADAMLHIALIWQAVRGAPAGGLGLLRLGIVLSLAAIVPLTAQHAAPGLRSWLATRPARAFAVFRLAGLALSLVLLAAPALWQGGWLLPTAACFATVIVFSQQSLETLLARGVLAGAVDANLASRVFQSAIQLSGLFGYMLGGVLIDGPGVGAVAAAMAVSFAVGGAAPALIGALGAPSTVRETTEAPDKAPDRTPWLKFSVLSAIGFLTAHVGLFNVAEPVLFVSVYHWTALQFSLIGVAMGAGGLIAALLRRPLIRTRRDRLACCAVLLAATVTVAFARDLAPVLAGAAALAFAINKLRTDQRATLYASVASPAQAALWSARLTASYHVLMAAAPLAATAILAALGTARAGALFVVSGAIAAAGVGAVALFQGRGARDPGAAARVAPAE